MEHFTFDEQEEYDKQENEEETAQDHKEEDDESLPSFASRIKHEANAIGSHFEHLRKSLPTKMRIMKCNQRTFHVWWTRRVW